MIDMASYRRRIERAYIIALWLWLINLFGSILVVVLEWRFCATPMVFSNMIFGPLAIVVFVTEYIVRSLIVAYLHRERPVQFSIRSMLYAMILVAAGLTLYRFSGVMLGCAILVALLVWGAAAQSQAAVKRPAPSSRKD